MSTFAIVGASLAGATAAAALRAEGFDGRIVLIGDELEPPYERPPLSKAYLCGEADRARLRVHPDGLYAEQEIDLRLGRAVTELDPAIRQIALDDGERLAYDRLLLATGAEPRRLAIPGAGLDGVLSLRTLADADRLRERLERGGSVAIVGAGWIGAEVAASARRCGLDVTLIDPLSVPLERVLGPELGAVYGDVHAAHGVRLRLGTGVEAFEGAGRVERVRTTDGAVIECDFVVVGVGALPRTALATRAGLRVADGILVDEHLESSASGVYAAGDVARARHPLYAEPLRVEHWATALHHGAVAARAMLGRPAVADAVPFFFSDQYDIGMEYSGVAAGSDRIVYRGDPAGLAFVAFWLAGDRVVAGLNVNVWDVAEPIQRLIVARTPVDDRRLADPEVPLDALAGATP
jgi:3-phenylpropionate/trans-cinnamate dioxygenase ferredoxin reductase subunit